MRAISYYNLGYTIEQTRAKMAKRYHQKIPSSTLCSWIKEYRDVCRFARLRRDALKLFDRGSMIFSHSLQHNQVYNYRLHQAKLAVRDFKCAWFDHRNYYEFFPLHAVYEKR